MNLYNPLAATKRLEPAGMKRRMAEAIASEINDGKSDLVTKEDLRQQLDATLDKQTIKLGGFVAALFALATTILGMLISLK
jgi:hypothetical protein